VGVRRMRHAIPTGLLADACAVVLSVIFCRLLLG
jgi:spore maturation protein SpmB